MGTKSINLQFVLPLILFSEDRGFKKILLKKKYIQIIQNLTTLLKFIHPQNQVNVKKYTPLFDTYRMIRFTLESDRRCNSKKKSIISCQNHK